MARKKKVNLEPEIEEKLKYIGLSLDNISPNLEEEQPLNYRVPRDYDENQYKQYRYIPVSKISILLTPTNRLDELEEKYRKATPLIAFLDNQSEESSIRHSIFLNMLKQLSLEELKKLEKEQQKLSKNVPFRVKYENNYIWQIYYAPETNKYFMLVPTTEVNNVALFYLIKKQIESKKSKKKCYIFVPITHMEYSGNLYTSLQITDLENYLWYFTKEWPTIFEVFDKKGNSTIKIVGKAKVYDNIVSDYIMEFNQKDICIAKYKLLKALFLLSTSFPNDYSFKTAIGEEGELEFKYKNQFITYESLPEFIKGQAKDKTEEIKEVIKEKAKKYNIQRKVKLSCQCLKINLN